MLLEIAEFFRAHDIIYLLPVFYLFVFWAICLIIWRILAAIAKIVGWGGAIVFFFVLPILIFTYWAHVVWGN